MSNTVTAAVSYGLPQTYPGGTVASLLLTLTPVAGGVPITATAAEGATSIVVSSVPEGTYTGTLALVLTDASGNAVPGAPAPIQASAPVTVAGPAPATVSFAIPASLNLAAS